MAQEELSPGGSGDIAEIVEHGRRLRKAAGPEAALEVFDALLSGAHGPLDEDHHRSALGMAFKCLASLGDWSGAEARARQAVALFPTAVGVRLQLADALLRLGRLDECEQTLTEALRLDPASTEARSLMAAAAAKRDGGAYATHVRPWPMRPKSFENARGVIEKYVLRGRPTRRFIGPDSVFMTLGSCFAENLAVRLRKAGRPVSYEAIGEDVNSTYANRALLEWIEHGPRDETTETMERVFGPAMRQRFLDGIRRSGVFIMTLGVAPCFFERTTGRFAFASGRLTNASREYLYGRHVMRTTTVAENVDNVRAVMASLERIRGKLPNVVLTVSPVPLAGTTEFGSALEADCISKSTLRLACHEVMTAMVDQPIAYWPSFEIVRWLGAYYAPFNPPVFGVEDDNTRHVSGWLVDLIVELFLDYYARAEGGTAA